MAIWIKNFGFSLMFGDVTALAIRWDSRWKGKLWIKTMPGPVRIAVTRLSPCNSRLTSRIPSFIGNYYLKTVLQAKKKAFMVDLIKHNTY